MTLVSNQYARYVTLTWHPFTVVVLMSRQRSWHGVSPTARALVVVSVLLCVAALVATVVTRSSGPTMSWQDNFSGSAGSAPGNDWSYQTGGDGFGNGELECYTNSRSNSQLDGDGHLVITAKADSGHTCSDGKTNDFTSARLTTMQRFTQRYGQFVVRAKLPAAAGIWPAFWALGDNHSTVGWPRSGEIDVVETAGARPVVHGTVHGPSWDDANVATNITGTYQLKTALSAAFHDYGVTWSPTRVVFTVDGHAYRIITKDEVRTYGPWVFDHPFYLMLNVAVGGKFQGVGLPDVPASGQWQQRMIVDWVRVTK